MISKYLIDPLDILSLQVLGLGVTVTLERTTTAVSLKLCASWSVGCWSREWIWVKG